MEISLKFRYRGAMDDDDDQVLSAETLATLPEGKLSCGGNYENFPRKMTVTRLQNQTWPLEPIFITFMQLWSSSASSLFYVEKESFGCSCAS